MRTQLSIVLVAAVLLSVNAGSLSFNAQTEPLTSSGGTGLSLNYDVTAESSKCPCLLKCDILDSAFAWYGYNDGDPVLLSENKGTIQLKLVASKTLDTSSNTKYQASAFIVSKKEYEALANTDTAWELALAQNKVNLCFSASCATGKPPVASNPCDKKPCQNGGECSVNGNSFTCQCAAGYTGETCSEEEQKPPVVEAGPCDNSPCQNGGTCESDGDVYSCNCKTNYTGTDCATRKSSNNTDPCKNANCATPARGGQCKVVNGAAKCSCVSGYSGDGKTCTRTVTCADDSCPADATCDDGNGKITCICNDENMLYNSDSEACEEEEEGSPSPSSGNKKSSGGSGVSPVLIALIVVLAVALVGAGGYFLYSRRHAASSQFSKFEDTTSTATGGAPPPPAGAPMGRPAPPAPRPPPPC